MRTNQAAKSSTAVAVGNRWEIGQNFRRAVRLNLRFVGDTLSFAELRALYRLAAAGIQFGLSSGYAP